MKQKKSKRERILEVALKRFIRDGVSQSPISQIAKDAGIDHQLLYYYFPDLDSLYLGVIQSILESINQHVSSRIASLDAQPEKQLRAYVSSYFEWAAQHRDRASIWLQFYYLASFKPAFAKLNGSIRDAGRMRIESFVHRGVEAGIYQLPPKKRAAEVAHAIQAIIAGQVILEVSETTGDPVRGDQIAWMAISPLIGI